MALRNNAKLRDASDPDCQWVNSVFIMPALTPKEQEKDKALKTRTKCYQLKIYKIKNGYSAEGSTYLYVYIIWLHLMTI